MASMSALAEFADAVGGERVDVTSLVPIGGDPHTDEPVPEDAARVSDADLVLDNGLGLSPWFEALRTNVDGHLLVLVTYEDAYGYFANRYDVEVTGTVLGATTEEGPSAHHLREFVDLVKRNSLPAVFPQVAENPSVMERLAEDAGAPQAIAAGRGARDDE